MKKIIFISLIFLSACRNKSDVKELNTIAIGEYEFDFPPDFKLTEEQGGDSYVGKIQGDNLSFSFDFGYYSSGLVNTPEEFFNKHGWLKMSVASRFLEEGVTYDDTNLPDVKILDVQFIDDDLNVDFIVNCEYQDSSFNVSMQLPQQIKNHCFEIDTIGNYYVKLVYPKDSVNGTMGLYVRNLNSFNNSINSYKSLSVSTENMKKKYFESALGFLKSVRTKEGFNLMNP